MNLGLNSFIFICFLFVAFLSNMEIEEEVLKDSKNIDLPNNSDKKLLYCATLADKVSMKEKNIIQEIIAKFPQSGSAFLPKLILWRINKCYRSLTLKKLREVI